MNESDTRIALCHEWVTTFGGSEQVASRIADALDIEDVYTYVAERRLRDELFPSARVQSIVPAPLEALATKHWQWFLPVMPLSWGQLDLSGFDVVITSAHSCVNAIDVRPAVHISYCHTPMRYAWEWRTEVRRFPAALRPFWPGFAAALRHADRRWSRRVTRFVANSRHVAGRIRRYYGREADVLYPPIDTDFWSPQGPKDNYYVFAGRLVAYKRADIAIAAANELGFKLVVAGSGPELAALKRTAGSSVAFVEAPTREELRDIYRGATALLLPGVEDFGMTLVEAQACGTPVIALARGGATEAVAAGRTGFLYDDEGVSGLIDSVRSFDPTIFLPNDLQAHAARFSVDRFDLSLRQLVREICESQ